jgi:DNA-binding PadR family transcriptional regulator
MSPKTEVWQGTLALMVLKTLNATVPQHGYGIARRIASEVTQRAQAAEIVAHFVALKGAQA